MPGIRGMRADAGTVNRLFFDSGPPNVRCPAVCY